MPLLGRGKGGSSAASSSQTTPATATTSSSSPSQRPTCESPLFGVRKQLALGSSSPASSSSTSSSPSSPNAMAANSATPVSEIPQQISRQQIHYAFSMMDTNKDGMIDLRELSQMLANLGVPIDEAVLSHVICGVSKRGERRISEADFLDWISHFIQIISETSPSGSPKPTTSCSRAQPKSPGKGAQGSRQRIARSSTASSSLVAQPSEPGTLINRNRRGSGSGLALMRSLSSSAKAAAAAAAAEESPLAGSGRPSPPSSASIAATAASADSEARNDLRAAFGVFDIDGDGFITLDEVRAGLKLLGESWTQAELKQVFAKCTTNGQRISIDDFVKLLL